MIAPEKWYEYQREYQRYGFDMKPQPEERRTRTGSEKNKKSCCPFRKWKKSSFFSCAGSRSCYDHAHNNNSIFS